MNITKKATMQKTTEVNFSLNNVEQVFPNIDEVEQTDVKRLEQGNKVDERHVIFPDSHMSYN